MAGVNKIAYCLRAGSFMSGIKKVKQKTIISI